jgi:uncharacterized membrane protein
MSRVQVAAVVAAVAGVVVSIYLTVLHYAGSPAACPVSGPVNCELVLTSPYAIVAATSIPTSVAGILWFALSALLWTRRVGWTQVAWSAIGMVVVLYLVFIEIVKLGAICLWCTVAHVLVLLIFLIAVTVGGRRQSAY